MRRASIQPLTGRAERSRASRPRTVSPGTPRKANLEKRGITVLSAAADEVPGVYKDIEEVMASQADLVEKVARFEPRIVRMAGEHDGPPED